MKHYHVGVATNFEVLWYTSDGTDNTTPSKLKRTIGDYTDYEMPPIFNTISASAIPHKVILPIKRMFDITSFPTKGIADSTLNFENIAKYMVILSIFADFCGNQFLQV